MTVNLHDYDEQLRSQHIVLMNKLQGLGFTGLGSWAGLPPQHGRLYVAVGVILRANVYSRTDTATTRLVPILQARSAMMDRTWIEEQVDRYRNQGGRIPYGKNP